MPAGALSMVVRPLATLSSRGFTWENLIACQRKHRLNNPPSFTYALSDALAIASDLKELFTDLLFPGRLLSVQQTAVSLSYTACTLAISFIADNAEKI